MEIHSLALRMGLPRTYGFIRKSSIDNLPEFFLRQETLRIEREVLDRCHHLQGFFFAGRDAKILQGTLDGIDAAAFAQNHFGSWLAYHIPVIREKFRRISLATILEPTGNDPGLNLK